MSGPRETPNFRQQAIAAEELFDNWREAMRREGWVYTTTGKVTGTTRTAPACQ